MDENQKGDTCWNKIDYILKKHPTVRKICNKLKRNLQLIENENTSFTFNRKHCYDLNYWLYYVVSNDLKINDNDSDFYEIIDRLQDVWKFINNSKKSSDLNSCNTDDTLIDIKVLKEVKCLFYFIEDFSIMKSAAMANTRGACKIYFEYLECNVPLYYKWEKICTVDEDNTCKSIFTIMQHIIRKMS